MEIATCPKHRQVHTDPDRFSVSLNLSLALFISRSHSERTMQALLADIGNSSIKLAIINRGHREIDCDQVIRITSDLFGEATERFQAVLTDNPPTHCFVSSVNGTHLQVFLKLVRTALPGIVCKVLTADDVKLKSDVQSRESLGIDRLLAARAGVALVAAQSEQRCPLIVIDAGTAVTIDLVDAGQVFKGGVIFPGAETSLRALHRSTGDLPDLSDELTDVNLDEAIGNSTRSAMLNGVLSAQAGAIRSIVKRISNTLDSMPCVIASGGGIQPIRNLLPEDWHYVDHLVLRGIAEVAMDCRGSDISENS